MLSFMPAAHGHCAVLKYGAQQRPSVQCIASAEYVPFLLEMVRAVPGHCSHVSHIVSSSISFYQELFFRNYHQSVISHGPELNIIGKFSH